MSDNEKTGHVSYPAYALPWGVMFILIKVAGTTLANWSWWLLLPVVPDLAFIFHKLGWTL